MQIQDNYLVCDKNISMPVSESRPQGRKRENTPETVLEELGIFLSIYLQYLSIASVYLGYISLLRTGRGGGRGNLGKYPKERGEGAKQSERIRPSIVNNAGKQGLYCVTTRYCFEGAENKNKTCAFNRPKEHTHPFYA
jgi:hypothetical protein